jgi:hypothetical protein
MVVKQVQYETLLSTCSEYSGALALLRQYRPYLEAIPSMRRPEESIVTVPLPNIRVRQPVQSAKGGGTTLSAGEAVPLPCDVVLMMCDPEWKIKTGVELFYPHPSPPRRLFRPVDAMAADPDLFRSRL